MASAPTFHGVEITPQQPSWDANLNDLIIQLNTFLNEMPSQTRRVYRISADNPDIAVYLSLVNFPAGAKEGHECWIMDPGGANVPAGPNFYAYSNGTSWYWRANDQLVAGIS